MRKREKLLIYPYDIEFLPLIEHSVLLKGYEVTGVCSPSGWGLSGKDAGEAGYCENTGFIVQSNFEEILEDCDTVLFSESKEKLDFGRFVYPKLMKSIEAGKNILCIMEIKDDMKNQIEDLCGCKGVYFKYFNNKENKSDKFNHVDTSRIYEVNTPVVFVIGTGGFAWKFRTQLALREKFIKEGYRVSQIGSRHYCELFGFHSFPDFMNGNIPEVNKVYLFNKLVKQIEGTENPDVIIIGIPGTVMPYNNVFTNGFGITAYEVCNALTPDAVVMCVHYANYNEEYFNLISTSMRYKLGLEVDCFNIANVLVESKDDSSVNSSHMILRSDNVDRKKILPEFNTPILNVLSKSDADKIGEHIINKLESYAERGIV